MEYATNDKDIETARNEFEPLDESTDLQLHPLRESTWAEIFPVLSFFEAFKSDEKQFMESQVDLELRRRRSKVL